MSVRDDDRCFPPIEEIRRMTSAAYAESFRDPVFRNTDPFSRKASGGRPTNEGVCAPESPGEAFDRMQEMDEVYALPYMRNWHPIVQWRRAGSRLHPRGQIQSGQQPGLFRGLQLLRPDLSSGTGSSRREAMSLILEEAETPDGGAGLSRAISMTLAGPPPISGLPACEKQMTKVGTCPDQPVSLSETLQKPERLSHQRLSEACFEKLRALPEVKKVFHPVRNPVRLCVWRIRDVDF